MSGFIGFWARLDVDSVVDDDEEVSVVSSAFVGESSVATRRKSMIV